MIPDEEVSPIIETMWLSAMESFPNVETYVCHPNVGCSRRELGSFYGQTFMLELRLFFLWMTCWCHGAGIFSSGEVLPLEEEFKYLRVLERIMEQQTDMQTGAVSAEVQIVLVCCGEEGVEARLSIHWLIYVPSLTYGHELE